MIKAHPNENKYEKIDNLTNENNRVHCGHFLI